jgi:gamma-glutamylcyclotransferase
MEKNGVSNGHIEEEVGDHFYYFAYGSNLFTERLHILNPSAIYVCNAVLTGYRLGFGGHSDTWGGSAATILEDKGQVVCGVVWKLEREHSLTLDIQERQYRRLHVDVKILPFNHENVLFTNGHTASFNTIRVRTYQMILHDDVQSENKPPCLPSPQYKRVILNGSKEHRLPLEYHKRLEAMPDNGFSGPVFIRLSIFEDGFE